MKRLYLAITMLLVMSQQGFAGNFKVIGTKPNDIDKEYYRYRIARYKNECNYQSDVNAVGMYLVLAKYKSKSKKFEILKNNDFPQTTRFIITEKTMYVFSKTLEDCKKTIQIGNGTWW